MKKLMICAIALSMFSLLRCGGDDGPPPEPAQQKAFKMLKGTWKISGGSIKVGGVDESTQYPGFSLSFTEKNYTSSNGGKLFSENGSWSWKDKDPEKAKNITLDGKEITITELTASKLVFTFTFSSGGSVAAGISGNYTVTLSK